MSGTHSGRPVRCPRCGYDLRGSVASWQTSCPIDGTCAECGLGYRWRDVMRPDHAEPTWCIEFCHRSTWIRASIKTSLISLILPWRFWTRLRMSHAVQWRRLGMYIVFLLLVCAMMWIIMQSALAWRTHREITAEFQQQFAPWYVWREIAIMQNRLDSLDSEAAPPFGRRSIDEERAELQKSIDALEASELEEVVSVPRLSDAMGEAIFTPWREESRLELTVSDYDRSYPGPRHLLYQYVNPWLVADASETWMMLRNSIGVMWILSVLMPASFILLPITRRRFRVQWRHIARVAGYGVVIPIVTGIVAMAFLTATNIFPNILQGGPVSGRTVAWITAVMTAALPLLFILLWWWKAMRHYLKMPNALAVSVAMIVMCLLLIALVAIVTTSRI